MSRSPRRARAVIDADHVGRLEALADAASARLLDVAEPLFAKLATAKILSEGKTPANVITMGTADLSRRHQRPRTGRHPGLA